MENVLEKVSDEASAAFQFNDQPMSEKQTCLKRVFDMVTEKWPEVAESFFPMNLGTCPNQRCYREAGFAPEPQSTFEDIVINNFEANEVEVLEAPSKGRGRSAA